MEISMGCACSISTDIPQVRIKAKRPGNSSKEQTERIFSV